MGEALPAAFSSTDRACGCSVGVLTLPSGEDIVTLTLHTGDGRAIPVGISGAHAHFVARQIVEAAADADAEVSHLIAAAPDLYEALQWLYAIVARDGLLPLSVSYMQNAEAALAKARGEKADG